MLKLKNRKSAQKRYKKTGAGKFLRRHAYKGHLLRKKSNLQKRVVFIVNQFKLKMASNNPNLIYGESTSLLQAQAEDSLIKNGRISPLPETETDNVDEIVKVSCSENTDIGIVRSSTYKSFIGKSNEIIKF